MIKKGIFDIVDTSGGTKVIDYNHEKRMLAYEAGCYLILWDLELDKKVMMHPHEFQISFIMFFGTDQEFILSIDRGLKPTIFISQWHTLTRLHQIYLPQNLKNQPVKNFKCAYSIFFNSLIIAENYNDRYIFSIWLFKRDSLNLLLTNDEENMGNCLKIHLFEHKLSLLLSIVERRCIKYWKLENKRLLLVNRIHVKEDIIDTQMSSLTSFVLFLGQSGRLYIINSEGQFISSMIHPELQFSALSIHEDYLFIGTLQGEVEIYQISSMKFVKNLTYYRDTVHNHWQILTTQQIHTSHNSEGTNNLETLIQQIIWNPSSQKTFVSCSDDAQIRIWNFFGDRWRSAQLQPFEKKVVGLSTLKFTHGTKNQDFSFREKKKNLYKIPAMDIDWLIEELYIGDTSGNIMIFDLKTGKLKATHSLANCKISHITMSSDYIGITLSTGEAVLYDKNSNFSNPIKVEEAQVNIGTQIKFHKGLCLLETEKEQLMKKAMEVSKNSAVLVQDQIRASTQRFEDNTQTNITKDINVLKSSSIKVISVHDLNTLRLHQINKNQNTLTSICLVKYVLEGRIVEFRIHPSNDYLIILTNDEKLNILKLANGELKGFIEVKRFSTRMTIDPSGLYAIIASQSPLLKNSSASSPRKSGRKDTLTSFLKGESTELDEIHSNKPAGFNKECFATDQSIISVYEIGTGDFIGEIGKIPTVSSLSIAFDSSYVAVGTKKGVITILALDPNIRENIYEVLDGIRINPNFWNEHPFLFDENVQSKILPSEESRKSERGQSPLKGRVLFNSSRQPEFEPNEQSYIATRANDAKKRPKIQFEDFSHSRNFQQNTLPKPTSQIQPLQDQESMMIEPRHPESYIISQPHEWKQHKNFNQKNIDVGVQSDDIITEMTTYIPFDGVKDEDLNSFRKSAREVEFNSTPFRNQIRPIATQESDFERLKNPFQIPKIATQSLIEVAKGNPNLISYRIRNEDGDSHLIQPITTKPKIYKDAEQQMPLYKGLEDEKFDNLYRPTNYESESKFERQQVDPSQRMYKSNLMVRNIRPDPDDIDNDDFDTYDPYQKHRVIKSGGKVIYDSIQKFPRPDYTQEDERHLFSHKNQAQTSIQADPDGIDDSVANFPEEEYDRLSDRKPFQQHQNEHYSTARQFRINNEQKSNRFSQSDLNGESLISGFDQISEFERKLNTNIRPYNTLEYHYHENPY